jgi:dipeptidyl aminopeptidase/acylaminoacyl peptidase
VLYDWPSGSKRVLAPQWDRSPSSSCFSADGRTLYASAANLGQHSLFAIDVTSGRVQTVVRDGHVQALSVVGERIVYALSTMQSPAELYSVRPDGTGARKLTDVNGERIAAAKMGDFEQFTFAGWNGETVYAYVVKPVDFDPARKYTLWRS